MSALEIKELRVWRPGAARPELDRFSLSIEPGETVVLLGEAGCGKEAIMRVLGGLPESGDDISGTLTFAHANSERASRHTRPFPRAAWLPGLDSAPLNRDASVRSQLARVIARRLRVPQAGAEADLDAVLRRLDDAPSLEALDAPPGQIRSETIAWGLLATAFAQSPELLLADHPLAGLAPIHARVLAKALLAEQKRAGFAILYAASNTEPARLLGGRLIVMRHGRVVEEGPCERLATSQAHAYTQTLFKGAGGEPPSPRNAGRGEPVLQVYGLDIAPRRKNGEARESLTFELRRGASLALIGEDGSGRRDLANTLVGLSRAAAGRVVLDAVDVGILSEKMLSRLRRRIAFVTGDDDVLDPRMTIWDTVAEPLRAHLRLPRAILSEYGEAALKRVGLASLKPNTPVAALSAFDRRRLQVARAIVTAPVLAVLDEPLRGLDAFAQSVMLDLLRNFRAEVGPALLVVTADFGVARTLAETALVLKDGRIVERGPLRDLPQNATDPFARSLIEASGSLAPDGLPKEGAGV
ncbi:MAG TPA: ATP-binding cassette domain-containing protein [Rhizomicrobium sp.]|nr:ATP-binding cassette domain-containing protein [Rhizomicrobium sp.]